MAQMVISDPIIFFQWMAGLHQVEQVLELGQPIKIGRVYTMDVLRPFFHQTKLSGVNILAENKSKISVNYW